MRRKFVLAAALLCSMSALCGLAAGQVPQLLDFQGRLEDGSGDPVTDGSYSMVFRLYDAPAAGSQIGAFSETQSVSVADGVFNATIGSATVGGIDPSLFDNPAVYLSITVEGEELLPRQQVVSVAYAFGAVHADEADNATTADNANLLDGLDSFAFSLASHTHSGGGMTAAEILAAIKTVDGSGSGLDADLLDGLDRTAFSSSGHSHSLGDIATAKDLLNAVKTVDGSGSGLDADLLDGQHGSYYRSATNLNAGTLSTTRFSAYSDLTAEARLDNSSGSDLPTRSQADGRYVNVTGDTMTGALTVNALLSANSLTVAGNATINNVLYVTPENSIGGIICGTVEHFVANLDIGTEGNLKADRSLYLGSSKGDGDIHAENTAGSETLFFDAGNATLNIGATKTAGTVAIKSSSNANNILLSGSNGNATFAGKVTAGRGLQGQGVNGFLGIWPNPGILAVPGVRGVGTGLLLGAPGVEAVGGNGFADTAFRSYGNLLFLTHDRKGTYLAPGDGSTNPALSIRSSGSSTTKPLMHLDGDLGFSAGEGLKLETGDGSIFSVYGSTSTSVDQLRFSGPSSGELLFDWANATIKLGGSTADTVRIPAIITSDKSGAGAMDASVIIQHESSSGIAIYGKVTSTDACAVFANSGTGDIIRGFSSGNLVFRVKNSGRVVCTALRITGGGDLAEPFDVNDAEAVKPGMVLAIDPDNAGKLRIATKAYDRTVAGIVSGANGVQPGVMMQQEGTAASGSIPVALTGRVYCLVDASNGAIRPGDLLTTSDTPGHAMKVTDYDRARGAIIGKAMTLLKNGRGLVLVLVTLQ